MIDDFIKITEKIEEIRSGKNFDFTEYIIVLLNEIAIYKNLVIKF